MHTYVTNYLLLSTKAAIVTDTVTPIDAIRMAYGPESSRTTSRSSQINAPDGLAEQGSLADDE